MAALAEETKHLHRLRQRLSVRNRFNCLLARSPLRLARAPSLRHHITLASSGSLGTERDLLNSFLPQMGVTDAMQFPILEWLLLVPGCVLQVVEQAYRTIYGAPGAQVTKGANIKKPKPTKNKSY